MANGQAEAGPPVGYGAADDADANGNEEDEGLRAPSGLQRFQGAGSTVVMALRVASRFQDLRQQASDMFIEPQDLTTVRHLGDGGFASVDECLLHGQNVAVKRLKPELFANDTDLKNFVTEGVTIARLRHPSIVRVVGLGFREADDRTSIQPESLFIAQELCLGGSLRDKVLKQMTMWNKALYTYTEGLRWTIQITEGLAYLHGLNPTIIHRDLKLDNVLMSGKPGQWDAKIADFGLHATVDARNRSSGMQKMQEMSATGAAKDYNPSTGALSRTVTLSNKSGVSGWTTPTVSTPGSSGTPRRLKSSRGGKSMKLSKAAAEAVTHDLTGQTGSFLNMAPEVVLKRPYNEKADIFSLGCCIFEIFSKSVTAAAVAVTGEPDEFEKIALKVAEGYRRPLPEHWPQQLAELVTECMAQEPRDRPTAAQVVVRLKSAKMEAAIETMDVKEAARLGGCCVVQ